MPAGGSCCSRLKSRISRFLAGVDMSASQTPSSGPDPSPPPGPSPLLVPDARGGEASEREAGGGRRRRVRKGVSSIDDAERERRDVTFPFRRALALLPRVDRLLSH
jgi:hypothetical protein